MEELNVYYWKNPVWAFTEVFKGVVERLEKRYPEIKFNCYDTEKLRKEHYNTNEPGEKYGPFYLMIENPENKKYIVVSYWDRLTDITTLSSWDHLRRVEILASCGTRHFNCFETPNKVDYTPISYTYLRSDYLENISKIERLNLVRQIPEKPTMRGFLYGFRAFLEKDDRLDIRQKFTSEDKLDYLIELRSNLINLSVNGVAEVCNRDIEILGTGSALFRTRLNTVFHNNLIPDYHYISVDTTGLPETTCERYWGELKDRILDRYESVRKDLDYVEFVRQNGYKWFQENGTIDKNIEIVLTKLDINKLK